MVIEACMLVKPNFYYPHKKKDIKPIFLCEILKFHILSSKHIIIDRKICFHISKTEKKSRAVVLLRRLELELEEKEGGEFPLWFQSK